MSEKYLAILRQRLESQFLGEVERANGRVRFRIGETPFDLADWYYHGGALDRDGALRRVDLWAVLPEYAGYDPERTGDRFSPGLKEGDPRLQIHLSDRRDIPNVETLLREREALEWSPFHGRVGSPDDTRHGLEYYRAPSPWVSSYLLRRDGRAVILLDCDDEERSRVPFCRARWDHSADVAAELTFPLKRLPEWRTLWLRARQILGGRSFGREAGG